MNYFYIDYSKITDFIIIYKCFVSIITSYKKQLIYINYMKYKTFINFNNNNSFKLK